MIRAKLVPVKHGISALMLAQKEAEIKSEDIPIYMHQGYTETKQPKYKIQTLTVMMHAVQIDETTTLCIPT